MQNGGFFEKPRTNSTGLGIVIAGHAVLLTAIALNPTLVRTPLPWTQVVTSIPDDDPPPPWDPPKPPKGETKTKPEQIDTIVKTDIPSGGTTTLQPVRPDAGEIIVQPPQLEPVFRQAVMDPKAIARFQPPYPSSMVRGGIEGSVTVRVLIGADGRVRAVELVNMTNPAFFDTTRDHALRSWRFQPATRDGVPTESWRTMTVKFRLES